MQPRIDYPAVAPEPFQLLIALDAYARKCGLDRSLYELVKIRASQINGCAFCLEMHCREARAHGETNARLDCLAGWREAPFYTDRERAALAWTEAVTLLHRGPVADEIYDNARAYLSEKELVDLNYMVVTINAFNRLAVPFHSVAGSYKRPE